VENNAYTNRGNKYMTKPIFKRRSINLDDKSYKIGKLLANNKALSLSALLRLMINDAYEQFQGKPTAR
jgi:hypothetical protein